MPRNCIFFSLVYNNPLLSFRGSETLHEAERRQKQIQGSLYQNSLKFVPSVLRKIKCTHSPMILTTVTNKKCFGQ